MAYYECILWNNQGTSDKLWGVTDYNGRPVSFWGRRGFELKYKLIDTDEATGLRSKKIKKGGYRETTMEAINDITPGFVEDFRHNLILCIMGDGFHRMHME